MKNKSSFSLCFFCLFYVLLLFFMFPLNFFPCFLFLFLKLLFLPFFFVFSLLFFLPVFLFFPRKFKTVNTRVYAKTNSVYIACLAYTVFMYCIQHHCVRWCWDWTLDSPCAVCSHWHSKPLIMRLYIIETKILI